MTQAPHEHRSLMAAAEARAWPAGGSTTGAALRRTAAVPLALQPLLAHAQTIALGTGGTAPGTFPALTQTAGPFPYIDLGIEAKATVAPQTLTATVGGETAVTPLNAPVGSQTLVPGTSLLNLSCVPSWTTGSVTTSRNGDVQRDLTFGIGPSNESLPITIVNRNTAVSGNLASVLVATAPQAIGMIRSREPTGRVAARSS